MPIELQNYSYWIENIGAFEPSGVQALRKRYFYSESGRITDNKASDTAFYREELLAYRYREARERVPNLLIRATIDNLRRI